MRIIAGSRRGARIFAPKGETRPTGDRVREAAFNLIGPVDEMAVLDLFAGSGAMGLEALSRGASTAVFVESDREAQRAIERNLEKLELTAAGRRSAGHGPAVNHRMPTINSTPTTIAATIGNLLRWPAAPGWEG